MVRRLVGAALVAFALFLGSAVYSVTAFRLNVGESFGAIASDVTWIIQVLRAGLAALGGALAVLAVAGGLWLAGAAALVAAAFAGIIILSGGDQSIWLDEAIYAAILIAGTIALARTRRE